MDEQHDLSVVIATYNRPDLVMRTIASVADQCEAVIVVDDCSTTAYDEDRLTSTAPHVRYIRLTKNSGPQVARNTGLDAVQTRWAVIIDDDDMAEPNSLRKAIAALRQVPNYERFRVFNFATSNGDIPDPFRIVTHGDYLTGTLKGDFTPVFNMAHPQRPGYVVPEMRGAGTDHMMWWQVASQEGIPTWRDIRLVKVTPDSAERLTSPETFIRYAEAFASMQSMTLTQIRVNGWDKQYPAAAKLRARALLLYALVSGNKGWVEHAVQQFAGIERLGANLAALLPSVLYQRAFLALRKRQLRHTH